MKKVGKNDLLPSKKEFPTPAETRLFPIIGIGASAGGLEALEQFFKAMPANCGMAFVIIQHLDPNHADLMPELLQRITSMNVSQATDGLKVKRDSVYVIPPNKSLSILHRTLHLFDPVGLHGLRLPIDIFFRSLALDMHEKSIGIILSGMGSDGSLGLKQIKEGNGLVLVQDPASAKFDAMPRNAIDAVIADIIAPAGELPARLLSFLKFVPIIVPVSDSEVRSKSSLDKIIILLREQSGHDFSLYKKTTLFRRIERRKGIHQIEKIQNYVRFLQENPKEVDILFKELLIGADADSAPVSSLAALRNSLAVAKTGPHPVQCWGAKSLAEKRVKRFEIVEKEAVEIYRLVKIGGSCLTIVGH
jgi:two-component system CheB/CheR fusion protein